MYSYFLIKQPYEMKKLLITPIHQYQLHLVLLTIIYK
jgi:hypothetical protein